MAPQTSSANFYKEMYNRGEYLPLACISLKKLAVQYFQEIPTDSYETSPMKPDKSSGGLILCLNKKNQESVTSVKSSINNILLQENAVFILINAKTIYPKL